MKESNIFGEMLQKALEKQKEREREIEEQKRVHPNHDHLVGKNYHKDPLKRDR